MSISIESNREEGQIGRESVTFQKILPNVLPHKFMAENTFNVISLFNGNGDPDGVNGRLYEHFLFLIPTNNNSCHEELLTRSEIIKQNLSSNKRKYTIKKRKEKENVCNDNKIFK